MEINDGTTNQRYCDGNCGCGYCDYCGSTPGPVTGTNITVKFYTSPSYTASGFLAVVCCSANITTTTVVPGE